MSYSNTLPDSMLIIKHHTAEGPGRILDWVAGKDIKLQIVEPDQPLPINDEKHAALILLGGPASANNDSVRWTEERQLVEGFRAAEKPVMGICLGAQLLAQTLGCAIKTMPSAELGWSKIHIKGHDLMVPQWHQDEIIANLNITVMGYSSACANQLFIADKSTIGIQFHPEWNQEAIEQLHLCFEDCPIPIVPAEEHQKALQHFLFSLLDSWWMKALSSDSVLGKF